MPLAMTEHDWIASVRSRLTEALPDLTVEAERKRRYAQEIRDYEVPEPGTPLSLKGDESVGPFAVDLLVGEEVSASVWRPRVALEVKIGISPQDAGSDAQKAFLHKTVSPYLRYGVLLLGAAGDSRELLIPQKGHFDFVLSLPGMELTPPDIGTLAKLIRQEVGASRRLEELV